MKKSSTFIFIILLLASGIVGRAAETTWVSSDKSAYIAGETLWCSLFCEEDGGRLSSFSKTGYVEIRSAEGAEAMAKISLSKGRGSGYLEIPLDIPTGNYLFVAYTLKDGSVPSYKVISIYNTLTSLRSSGCRVMAAPEYSPYPVSDTFISAHMEADSLFVINSSSNPVDACVSVFWDDRLQQAASIRGTLEPLSVGSAGEYEGEIIRLSFSSSEGVEPLAGHSVTVSFLGLDKYIFISRIDSLGRAEVHTGNIYGTHNLVCEVDDLPENLAWSVNISRTSPIANVPFEAIVPPLYLDSAHASVLEARSLSMQTHLFFEKEQMWKMDTLSMRGNVFAMEPDMVYELDDYKRFPTMKETISEILVGVLVKRQNRKDVIRMELLDYYGNTGIMFGKTYVIVDGVPVGDYDYDKVLSLDPALVKTIEIYNHTWSFGTKVVEGIMSIRTFRGDLGGISLDSNVKVLDYTGCCHPRSAVFADSPQDGEYPDLRSTVFWEPVTCLKPGRNVFHVDIPMYDDVPFRIIVDGISGDRRVYFTR